MAGMAIPILGFCVTTTLEDQFFPPSDRNQLQIEPELPPPSSLVSTLATAQQVQEVLIADPRVQRSTGSWERAHRRFITI